MIINEMRIIINFNKKKMYLPTFWKLTIEASGYRLKHMAGWTLPAAIMIGWIGFPSFYNWTYSTIIPPPTGVQKR